MLHLETSYQPQKFRAILSLLLAFAFIAISGVQILHSHNDASLIDEADHSDYVHATDKCVICQYIAHQQAQPAQVSYPSVILIRIPEVVTLQPGIYAGTYKSSLPGFANKAPPFISC